MKTTKSIKNFAVLSLSRPIHGDGDLLSLTRPIDGDGDLL